MTLDGLYKGPDAELNSQRQRTPPGKNQEEEKEAKHSEREEPEGEEPKLSGGLRKKGSLQYSSSPRGRSPD